MRVESTDRVEVLGLGVAREPSAERAAAGAAPENESQIAFCAYVSRSDVEIVSRTLRSVYRTGVRVLVVASDGAYVPHDLPRTSRVVRIGARLGITDAFLVAASLGISCFPDARFFVLSQDDAEYEPWAFAAVVNRGLTTRWCSLYTPDHVSELTGIRNRWVPFDPPQGGAMSAVSLGFSRDMLLEVLASSDELRRYANEDGSGLDAALATVFSREPISYHVPSPCQHIGSDRAPIRVATVAQGDGLPEYDVVVPYRDWFFESLLNVIRGVMASTRPPARVIVVDYGSERDRDKLARLPYELGVTLVRAESGCWCRPDANNLGLLRVRSPYVAFIDSDCVPSPALFERSLAELEMRGGASVALTTIYRAPDGWGGQITGSERSFPAVTRRSQGGFLMAKTDCVLECGAYRRSLCVWGAEDNDMVDRLAAHGITPFWVSDLCPEAYAVHQWHPESVTAVVGSSANDHRRLNHEVYRSLAGPWSASPSGRVLGVSILSFDRLGSLTRCIESVFKWCEGLPPRLYVGWSGRPSAEWERLKRALRRDGHVAITMPFCAPQGLCRNVLHSYVTEPILLYLDDDTYLTERTRLSRLVEALLSGWDVVSIANREPSGRLLAWWGRLRVTEGVGRVVHNPEEATWAGRWRVIPVDAAPATYLMWSKIARECRQCDYLDHWGHHLHWMLEMKRRGVRVCYTEDCEVYHARGGSDEYRKYRARKTPSALRFARLTGISVLVAPNGWVTHYE